MMKIAANPLITEAVVNQFDWDANFLLNTKTILILISQPRYSSNSKIRKCADMFSITFFQLLIIS